MEKQFQPQEIHLGANRLLSFFVEHLNHILCAKTHIVQSFPEVAGHAHFTDLKYAILETMENVQKQIVRMEHILKILDARRSLSKCSGLTAMLEEAFEAIKLQSEDAAMRDMSILFYLQNVESIEMTSFQILQMCAVRLKNKDISQLLKESFDEAKDDRNLMLMITAKYLTS